MAIAPLALIGYAASRVWQRDALPDVRVLGGAVYDGGTVPAGKTLAHIFRIENPHAFALGLEAPVAGCACTTATVSSASIPPHSAAEVTLRVAPEDGNITGSALIVTTHGRTSAETWLFVTGKNIPKGASTKSRTQQILNGRRAGPRSGARSWRPGSGWRVVGPR